MNATRRCLHMRTHVWTPDGIEWMRIVSGPDAGKMERKTICKDCGAVVSREVRPKARRVR